MKTIRELGERTVIPISLVAIIISGVVWITNLGFRTDANAVTLERVEKKADNINEIREDVAVIKEKITQIEKTIAHRR